MDRVNVFLPDNIAADPPAAEQLPDLIQELIKLAQADGGAHDITHIELMEALDIAWLAAERLRIERREAGLLQIIRQ
mgnify:CR=1 FL=1